MTAGLEARIEVARGELILGDLVVTIAPVGTAGHWRVGGAAGPVLRPLRFGERTRLSAFAATSQQPYASLGAAISQAATVVEGEVEDLVRQMAALLLCGAGEEGPSFGVTALRVARAAGWDLAQIVETDAAGIDRLAKALGTLPKHSGWRRFVIGSADRLASLTLLRDELAANLLARVEECGGAGAEATLAEERDDRDRTLLAKTPMPRDGVAVAAQTGFEETDAGPAAFSLERPAPPPTASSISTPGQLPKTAMEPVRPGASRRQVAVAVTAVPRDADDGRPAQPSVSTESRPGPTARPNVLTLARGHGDRLGLGAVAGSTLRPPVPVVGQMTAPERATSAAIRMPSPGSAAGTDVDLDTIAPDVADALAALLGEEADLRGLE